MAAGLPVLASDWDGLKGTVTADSGLRVTSRLLGPQHMANESARLQGGIDSFPQYSAAVSAMTKLDMGDERFMALDRSGQIGLQDMLALRNYIALNHIFTPPNRIVAVYDAVQAGEETVQAIATTSKIPTMVVERVLMWLLKYDFVRRIA